MIKRNSNSGGNVVWRSPEICNPSIEHRIRRCFPRSFTPPAATSSATLVVAGRETRGRIIVNANHAVACIVDVNKELGLRVILKKMKTIFLHHGSRDSSPRAQLKIGEICIQMGPNLKYLGLTLDGRGASVIISIVPRLGRRVRSARPNLSSPVGSSLWSPHVEWRGPGQPPSKLDCILCRSGWPYVLLSPVSYIGDGLSGYSLKSM